MKHIILLLALLLFGTPIYAQNVPSFQLCHTTNGNNCVPEIGASNSVPVSVSSNTTTQLVALVAGKHIYVTSFDLVTTAANTVGFVYGTGSSCGTGTTALTGIYGMSTFTALSKGNGVGAILFVPVGNALCIVTTTSAQTSGSVSYAQY